ILERTQRQIAALLAVAMTGVAMLRQKGQNVLREIGGRLVILEGSRRIVALGRFFVVQQGGQSQDANSQETPTHGFTSSIDFQSLYTSLYLNSKREVCTENSMTRGGIMNDSDLTRRQFEKLAMAALGGLVAGAGVAQAQAD